MEKGTEERNALKRMTELEYRQSRNGSTMCQREAHGRNFQLHPLQMKISSLNQGAEEQNALKRMTELE